jgi:hypothetical protein
MNATKSTTRPEPLLWLSDSRGVYIPRDFAASFNDRSKAVAGVSAEDWAVLDAGPDHALYWDAWTDVGADAVVTDEHGHTYFVWQDGDCWLIPTGMEWQDGADFFAWPEDDAEEEEG